jgi:outer membrane protein TolC
LNTRLVLCLLASFGGTAWAADPFQVFDHAAATPASPLRPATACDAAAPSGRLTLGRAIERALCANPATRSAWLNARLRAAELGQVRSEYLPEVGVNGTLAREGDSALPNDHTAWQLGIEAQVLLYDFGGRAARNEAAEALLAAARAGHDASVRLLVLQTVTAYFNVLTAQAAVAAANEVEASARAAFDAASARVAAGSAIPLDRLQARTAYTQRQIERIRAEGTAARLHGELAALMGDAGQTHFVVAEDDRAFSRTPVLSQVDALIDAARSRRPELRAAEAAVRAGEAGVKRAEADGKPRLSAFVDARRQDFGPLDAASSSSLGLSLTIPLFTGYRNTYQIAAARTQADLAAVERDDTANQVALDVWRAYYRLQSETEADRRSADLVESADAAARQALGRYQAGLGILLDTLNAQASLAQARYTQLLTRLGMRVARAELAQAIGELSWDWIETDLAEPGPAESGEHGPGQQEGKQ